MGEQPKVVAAAVIRKDRKVLLVKEVLENAQERWIIPGGKVDYGERIEDAAKREIKEELGIDIEIKNFIGFHQAIHTNRNYHTVIFFYEAEPLNDSIRICEQKILDAKYFPESELKNLDIVTSALWVFEKMGIMQK